jgi:hypothetical protein
MTEPAVVVCAQSLTKKYGRTLALDRADAGGAGR